MSPHPFSEESGKPGKREDEAVVTCGLKHDGSELFWLGKLLGQSVEAVRGRGQAHTTVWLSGLLPWTESHKTRAPDAGPQLGWHWTTSGVPFTGTTRRVAPPRLVWSTTCTAVYSCSAVTDLLRIWHESGWTLKFICNLQVFSFKRCQLYWQPNRSSWTLCFHLPTKCNQPKIPNYRLFNPTWHFFYN